MKEYVDNISEINIENSPACIWYFECSKFNNTKYRTLVYVSKIIPIFHIQHEFEVEDNNPDKMGPTLDGFGVEPYNRQQAELMGIIRNRMTKSGI
ncbi:hypothetical protein FDB28_09230 [Clostridium botulinum]|nr:hypothetical protein [Clostridium botulinum]NFS97744.1 hypothetical protein [Clostridium botulinum]